MNTLLTLKKRTGTTTWDGTWTNGHPTGSMDVILKSTYNTSLNGSFTCYNLSLPAGSGLTIATGTFIKVRGTAVTQVSGVTFTIADGGNFMLMNKDVNVSTVKVTITRLYPNLQLNDYRYISPPISGIPIVNVSPFTNSTRFYIYKYDIDPVSGVYVEQYFGQPTSTPTVAGIGWMIRVPVNFPTTLSTWTVTINNLTVGTLNKGIVSVPLDNHYSGYKEVGNPYAATISLRKFYEANKDVINEQFVIWDKTNGATGDTYVNLNKICAQRSTWDVYLRPFQGVMVKATNYTEPANVIFTPDMQVFQDNTTAPNRFYLDLMQGTVYKPMSSAMFNVPVFPESFKEVSSTAPFFGFIIGGTNYTMHNAVNWDSTQALPLRVNTVTAGNHTIVLSAFSGKFANYIILLYDAEAAIYTNLKADSFTFTATANTVYTTRFFIKFTLIF